MVMLTEILSYSDGVWDVLEKSGSQREPGLGVLEHHDTVTFGVGWRVASCLAPTLSVASLGIE